MRAGAVLALALALALVLVPRGRGPAGESTPEGFIVEGAEGSVAEDSAKGSAAKRAPDARIEIRDLGRGLLFARARSDLPCTAPQLYALLSDYPAIARWVSLVDSSTVVRRDSSGVLVRQVGTTTFVLHHTLRMTLRFRESPPRLLRFEIVSGDFPVYYGSWTFLPRGPGSRLEYAVTLRPPEFLPGPLVRHVLRRDLGVLLADVEREVRRRSVTSPAATSSPESLR